MRNDNRGLLIALMVLVAIALIGPMIGVTLFGPHGLWQDTNQAPGWVLALMAGMIGITLPAGPAALIVGIILLVRSLGSATSASAEQESQEAKVTEARGPALETLRQRYAAGEISLEEYEHMQQALGGSTTRIPRREASKQQ